MLKTSFHALGSEVVIGISQGSVNMANQTPRAFDDAQSEVCRLERMMSRFNQDSDVSRINASAGRWVTIQPETASVLRLALHIQDWTAGLFNPCLGLTMKNLGYDRSFEQLADTTEREETGAVHPQPQLIAGSSPLEVSGDGGQARVHRGFAVDLGGIAKSWIVQAVSDRLHATGYPQHVCSAGGDMVCRGKNGSDPWHIAIANPADPTSPLLTLDVESLCVATSGTYKRKWYKHGEPVHHIVDPRTGQAARTDICSCTVLHEDLVIGEALARSCLILGTREGLTWLTTHPQSGYVIVTTWGEVIHPWK